ncbi:MAG TPA: hypothetical protein ENJ82_10335, partial [Bacteroidetes bacterium]|nr:hypothetical protein [Bacteroidota bacterium]
MSNSNIPLEVREFNNKNDRKPVMLLPVRLETRFVKVKHVYRPEPNEGSPFYDDKTELWVRIYPDDISITTHEDGLSAPEIEAGKTYWQTYFEANGDSNLHLGAWRQLCVAHGPQRAAYVARQTQPTQFNPQDSTFSGPPVIDMQADKDGAWTQAPQTFAMPDRFVIILHRRNTAHDLQRSFHVCEPILGPLQVGPDPLGEDGFKDDVIEGELDFPDGMKWMADFEEAERVGMALRIRFGPEDSQKIENLVALGLNLQDSAADALEKVKELFENHRYTNGLSIIPQGTPTNNTAESGAGYQEDALGIDAMFEAERGALRYQDTEDPLLRKDGQWLADALGLDREQIGHLPHSDGTDIAETLNMNTALWPTTLRFYLENMMYPSLDEDTLNQTGAFFSRYVSGRGHIPAIRIGDQPYGILATSNFKAWSYSDLQHEFHQGMIIFFLKGMHSAWSNLVNNIPSLATGNVTEADEELLSVIGLHASSIEFHQRFLAGEDFLENLKSAANVGDTAVQGPENGSSQTQLTDGGHVFPAISSILNT